jgi:hypothetical protein
MNPHHMSLYISHLSIYILFVLVSVTSMLLLDNFVVVVGAGVLIT